MLLFCNREELSSPAVDQTCRPRRVSCATLLLICAPILLTGGCGGASKYVTPNRLEHGYIIILPGIEGKSYLNTGIANGLVEGGVPSAIEIYDWTAAGLFSLPVNLRAEERNRRQGRKIASKIMHYQDQYPGRPVHLIGHSGGGGVAVFALEALPPDRQISSAILLAPALAPDYDMRRALKRTAVGIWNFYSPHDVGFLRAGTTVMGTVDGQHTSAAGAVAFALPWGLDKEDRQLYSRLRQQPYTPKMAEVGHSGGHTGWARQSFVAAWLAPIVLSQLQDDTRYAADASPQPARIAPPNSSDKPARQAAPEPRPRANTPVGP